MVARTAAMSTAEEASGPVVASQRFGFAVPWSEWDLPIVQDRSDGIDFVLTRGNSVVHVMGMENLEGMTGDLVGFWRLDQMGVTSEQTAALRNEPTAYSARFDTGSESGIVSATETPGQPGSWTVILWITPSDQFAAEWPAVSALLDSIQSGF